MYLDHGREEAHSKGGSTSYVQVLGGSAMNNLQASDRVVWTLFQIVRDCTEMLGVTVESISIGEIGIRYWTGEPRAAAAAAAIRGTQGCS